MPKMSNQGGPDFAGCRVLPIAVKRRFGYVLAPAGPPVRRKQFRTGQVGDQDGFMKIICGHERLPETVPDSSTPPTYFLYEAERL